MWYALVQEVRDQLDVRILLRTPVALLKERRGSPEKSVWHLQGLCRKLLTGDQSCSTILLAASVTS
jgi:hypothetical protein